MQSIVPPLQSTITMKRFCFLLIFLFAGCKSHQVLDLGTANLNTIGPASIEVNSFGGNITIVVDATLNSAKVQVAQRDKMLKRGEEPQKQITWDAFVQNGAQGEMIFVETHANHNPMKTLSADVTIQAPSIHHVTANTENGDITIYGVSGQLALITSDGNIKVATPLVMNNDVTLETRRGNIEFRIRGESSAKIDATAINGNAALNMRYGDGQILSGTTKSHVSALFNDGVNSYTMRTVDGNISIDIVEDPIGSEPLFNTEWISW